MRLTKGGGKKENSEEAFEGLQGRLRKKPGGITLG